MFPSQSFEEIHIPVPRKSSVRPSVQLSKCLRPNIMETVSDNFEVIVDKAMVYMVVRAQL